MGGQTKGQQRAAADQARTPPPRTIREGVTVRYADDRPDLELEGDFEAQLTPSGAVAFIEMVPDLLNQNNGQGVPIARRFINVDAWAEIVLR